MKWIYKIAFSLAAVLLPFAACAEKANVFFIHGANVSEQDARAWASVVGVAIFCRHNCRECVFFAFLCNRTHDKREWLALRTEV